MEPSRDPGESRPDEPSIPVKRLLLWAMLGAVMLYGIYLYFLYEPRVIPLLDGGS